MWAILIFFSIIGVAALFMNDNAKAQALIQKCPKCGRRSLRKLKKDDPRYSTSKWKCSSCGNDEDEFGNKL